jgi:hypothetical protein
MNATLTTNPRFHALTGNQPIGQTQIATMPEYAGTLTAVKHAGVGYWVVTTRTIRDAFTAHPERGSSATVWFHRGEGRYVVDYCDGRDYVEADRTRTLKAAIGVAADVTAQRWFARQ